MRPRPKLWKVSEPQPLTLNPKPKLWKVSEPKPSTMCRPFSRTPTVRRMILCVLWRPVLWLVIIIGRMTPYMVCKIAGWPFFGGAARQSRAQDERP